MFAARPIVSLLLVSAALAAGPAHAQAPDPAKDVEVFGILKSPEGAVSVTLGDADASATLAIGQAFRGMKLISVSGGAVTLENVASGARVVKNLADHRARVPRATAASANPTGPFPMAAPPVRADGLGISTPASLTAPPPQGHNPVVPNHLPPPQGHNATAPTNLPPPQGNKPITPSGTQQ